MHYKIGTKKYCQPYNRNIYPYIRIPTCICVSVQNAHELFSSEETRQLWKVFKIQSWDRSLVAAEIDALRDEEMKHLEDGLVNVEEQVQNFHPKL